MALTPWEAVPLAWLVWFVLAALRIAPLTIVLPVMGGRNIPSQARLPILAVLTATALPSLAQASPTTVGTWVLIVVASARELAIGWALALVIGTRLSSRLNKADACWTGCVARVSPIRARLSNLTRLGFGVVFLAAGGRGAVVGVVFDSFVTWPMRADATLSLDRSADGVARWSANALQATLALFGAAFLAFALIELVLAFAARVSPPLAQSHIALPTRAVAPLVFLAITVGAWTGAARDLAAQALAAARALGP